MKLFSVLLLILSWGGVIVWAANTPSSNSKLPLSFNAPVYENARVVSGVLVSDRVSVAFKSSAVVKATTLSVGKTSTLMVTGDVGDRITVTDGAKVTVFLLTGAGQAQAYSSEGKNPLVVGCVHARLLTETTP